MRVLMLAVAALAMWLFTPAAVVAAPTLTIIYITPADGAVLARGEVYTTQVRVESGSLLNTTVVHWACSDNPVVSVTDDFDGTTHIRTLTGSCHLPPQPNRTYTLRTEATNIDGGVASTAIQVTSSGGKR